jgi:hypothetical protein
LITEDRKAPIAPAERMRRYRRRRREREEYVRIPLHATEIGTLIHMGLLTEDLRQDDEALQTAILSIVYRALEALRPQADENRKR